MSINNIRFLHTNNNDIPEQYKNYSLHIALERCDSYRDWETFRKLYKLAPIYLQNHLNMTSSLFDYNYLELSKKDRDALFV
jgi:hypothetical protein